CSKPDWGMLISSASRVNCWNEWPINTNQRCDDSNTGGLRLMAARFEELVGTAIIGIDTLWGGDVMCASGTGRFIADSWFSDEPLPLAYTHPSALPVRESGGVSSPSRDLKAIDDYLSAVNIPVAIEGLRNAADGFGGLRAEY